MKKHGFILTECLIAASLAGILLPLFARGYADFLNASLELRSTQRANVIAFSCLERAGSLYNANGDGGFEEQYLTGVGRFHARVVVETDSTGARASVEVRWKSGSGTKTIIMSRYL